MDTMDVVGEKLAKADFNLTKAKQHFAKFVESVGSTMFYEAGDELSETITRLKGTKNRICEAWLIREGYEPTEYDDRNTLAGPFQERAPRDLLRKAVLLEEKLTLLLYGHVYTDDAFDGAVAPPEQRLEEVAVCLSEVEELYLHIKTGRDMGSFRWERENNFSPGQWVLHLANKPIMHHDRNLALSRWIATEKLVLDAQGNVVIRTPYRRRIERIFIDSLYLRPSSRLPKAMTTHFDTRRSWFDLRPQLRQVPLVLPAYHGEGESLHYAHDFGSSLYFTCPCCGYPTMMTHPEYNCLHFDDDYDYSEICVLCDWADVVYNDDGYDENEPDDENFNYSLLQARQNFELHGSIFQPSDGVYYDCHHSPAVLAAKQRLLNAFDAMVGEGNKGKQFILWWQAEEARQELIAEMKSFENAHPEAYAIRRDSEGEVVGRRFDYKWRELMAVRPGDYVDDIIDHGSFIVALWQTSHGQVVMLRNYRRQLRPSTLGGDRRIPERSLKSFWTSFLMRRTWFEAHSEYLKGLKPCPCCGYPLLTGERSFEWCSLCCWEDDGQDDQNADEVLGGPNADLSLTEARKNFELTLCAFRPDDPEIESLAICRPGHLPWKQRLLGLYDGLITVESAADADALWEEIESCWEEFRNRV